MYIEINDQTEVNWDDDKNDLNYKKHKIWFEDVLPVFTDPFAVQNFDTAHSSEEERWNIIGRAGTEIVLFVVCTDRKNKIRLISARKGTSKERRKYYEKIRKTLTD